MRKVYKCAILILVLPILLSGCFMMPWEHDRKPHKFPNTTWETTDGTVRFAVGDDHRCIGTIAVDGNHREVIFEYGMELNRSMYIMDYAEWVESGGQRNYLERWECYYESEKKFTAVVAESTYFEKGQKFTFCRVEE